MAATSARCCARRGAAWCAAASTNCGSAARSMLLTVATSAAQSGSVAGRQRGQRHRPCSSRTTSIRRRPQAAHSRAGLRQRWQRHADPRTDRNARVDVHAPQVGAATAAAPVRRNASSSSPTTCGAGGRRSRNTSGRTVRARSSARSRPYVAATESTASRTAGITALGSAALTRSTSDSRSATAAGDVSTSVLIRRPR